MEEECRTGVEKIEERWTIAALGRGMTDALSSIVHRNLSFVHHPSAAVIPHPSVCCTAAVIPHPSVYLNLSAAVMMSGL